MESAPTNIPFDGQVIFSIQLDQDDIKRLVEISAAMKKRNQTPTLNYDMSFVIRQAIQHMYNCPDYDYLLRPEKLKVNNLSC